MELVLEEYKGQSVNSLCRTCLKVLDLESENFHDLQSFPYLVDLFNIIQSDKSISDLPPNICEFCYNKLQDIVLFQKQCNESFLNFQILIQNDILIPLVKLEETFNNGDSDFSDGEDKDFIDPLQTLENDISVTVPVKKPTKPKKPRKKKAVAATTSAKKEEPPVAEVQDIDIDVVVDTIIEEIKEEERVTPR